MFDQGAAADRGHRVGGIACAVPLRRQWRAMNKKAGKDKGNGGGTIALNKRARHEYHLEERFEAGLALQGWELKAIRAGRANIGESYAVVRDGELFLFGAQITPLISASTPRRRRRPPHPQAAAAPARDRQADRPRAARRLHPGADRAVLERQQGQAELALAKGKQTHDKREAEQGARLGAREAARDAAAQQGRLSVRLPMRAHVHADRAHSTTGQAT